MANHIQLLGFCNPGLLMNILHNGLLLGIITSLSVLASVAAEGQKTGSSESVGCFTCNSYNFSDPRCHDPYHPAPGAYTPRCESGMEGRVGTFPAHFCIKMNGINRKTGAELIVRTCSLLSMQHQCGIFEFDEEKYNGCITTCTKNGCNHGNSTLRTAPWWTIILLCLSIMGYWRNFQ